ncbi:decarboxylase [Colwellia sp. C1TZA3]|uniref:decarboxylase n=1 Tax=Colwellia sp. C1TZA3 TaxID=2508879 RepID=UPI0011BA1BFE|nr:decarboxylase [Colwellia sp. C1TZA3]TWX72956.1 decarboxylase [Colwellia sp. C1TZA3]
MKLNFDALNNLSSEHGDSFYLLYSDRFAKNYDDFLEEFQCIYSKTTIGYSYKTNYTPKLCKIIDDKGGYAEVVSDMEYSLAINIGVSPNNIIVNGPYKPKKALMRFLLNGSIVNLDSYKEVALLTEIANQYPDKKMLIGLRCNFDINNDSVSRFGLDVEDDKFFKEFYKLKELSNVKIMGIHCHFPDRNIESYAYRADKILALADKLFELPPSYIDIGGGYFGKMDDSLKKQFKSVHEYSDYAQAIATRFNDFYSGFDEKLKPTLILEPGSALVADTMEFVAKVIDIKNIRGSNIAMTTGSKFNLGLLSSSVNMPLMVFSGAAERTAYETVDISGYTCIESDFLYKNYIGYLNEDDYLVFSNIGSYSVVFKPPFILPNVPILEYDNITKRYDIIKRQETVDDIFQTFHI